MRQLPFVIAAITVGCGGIAVVDPVAEDGGSGGFLTVSSSSRVSSSASTGGSGGHEGGAPPIPPLVEEKLGNVPMSTLVSFTIPQGTFGFTAVAKIADKTTRIGFDQLHAPDSAILVAGGMIAGTAQYYQYYGSDVLAVPQTDDPQAMPLMTGTWQISMRSDDSVPSADLSIWRRQSLDGFFHGGRIDVNLFIAQGAPATLTSMQPVLAEAFSGYAGLELGNVGFQSLPPEYATISDANALQAFWETAGAPGKPALNVIVTGFIDIPGVAGFSPGAPALSLEHGTSQSGVVMMLNDPSIDWMVLAHEAGHFSGLMHTSELIGGVGDKLTDTPFCPNADLDPFSCPDQDNLMFPYGSVSLLRQLSSKQEAVIQASALHRGAVEAGGGFPEPLGVDGGSMDGAAVASSGTPSAAERSLSDGSPATAARWKSGLDAGTVALLTGHWCAHGASAPDHVGVLRERVGDGELFALSMNREVPAYARMRALIALDRGAPTNDQLGAIHALAMDTAEAALVRIGALRTLRSQAPIRAGLLGRRLATDPDAVVSATARRMLP